VTPSHDLHSPAIAVQAVGDGTVTVTIWGELDLATAPALSACLAQALECRPQLIVFDLAGVGFMDCASAHLIIEAARALPGSPPPVLRNPVFAVRRVLSVTGLDARCTIEP
jgi:anti-sigma B factor antagonist